MEAKLKISYKIKDDKYLVQAMFGRDNVWVQAGEQTFTPEAFISFQTSVVKVQGPLEITFHDSDKHKVLYTKAK